MTPLRAVTVYFIFAISISTAIIGISTKSQAAPPHPIFPDNYYARGHLSLPYAELREPFEAWYDKASARSRNDFYGDLYKIFQFGPNRRANNSTSGLYGVIYKLAYVPADFNVPKKSISRNSWVSLALSKLPGRQEKVAGSQSHKRVCFRVDGGIGFTVGPQTVLPDMREFSFQSLVKCPHESLQMLCECWRRVTSVGDKLNTYKMYLVRDYSNSSNVKPVFYSMAGYNNLFGSHFDRYDIFYHQFEAGGAKDSHFRLDEGLARCQLMPGSEESANSGGVTSDTKRRVHLISQNPFHEYVDEPHRYDHVDHQFKEFSKNHQKFYRTQEKHHQAWHNFLHNLRFINSKNRQLQSFKLGVNRFADENINDLSYLRGRIFSEKAHSNAGLDYNQHHGHLKSADGQFHHKLPDSWDWSLRGAVTAVKDQAVCGSCWSFGTTGTIEGGYFVKTGKLLRLSQQQLIDCSWRNQNNGCDGGIDFHAYQYIMEAGGLATEQDYGNYLAVDGKCHDGNVRKAVQISGWYNVTPNDREALKHAIVTYGPVSISIDASPATFTFYSHGVYYDPECHNKSDQLDHSVLVVGYTEFDGNFVWQVKNSWSTNWGNNGYIMISAEKNNCGVMDAATVPIIKAQSRNWWENG